MELIRPKLFNPTGDDRPENRKIFFGNPTNLFNMNEVGFPWAVALRKKMKEDFWISEKVKNFDVDIRMYRDLSDHERTAFNGIISYLTFLDSIQENNLPAIASYITASEVKSCLAQQMQQEDEHITAYQVMLETLINDKNERGKVYDFWKTDSMLYQRCEYITSLYENALNQKTQESYFYALIADYLLEGIYFYVGFQFFFVLGKRQLMPGTADMIAYINIDEEGHCKLFSEIIKDAMTCFPHSKEKIYELFNFAAHQEIEWVNHIIGNNVLGMTEQSNEDYIKYLTNSRLNVIGLDPIFTKPDGDRYTTNPYKHLQSYVKSKVGAEKANFFESTVTAYTQSSSIQGWDEL